MDIYLFSIVFLFFSFLFLAFVFSLPYSNDKITNRIWKCDYSLLLSSILIVYLCIYTEMHYKLFADKIGFEVLFISLFFLLSAYYFDHLILLSIALTGIATSIEFLLNPLDLFNPISFDKSETLFSIAFGVSLVLAARMLERKNIKSHFTFTHFNFAANLLYLYSLLGIFQSDDKIIYALVLLISSFYFMNFSFKENSKFLMLVSLFYPFIGFTYLIFHYWIILDRANVIVFAVVSLIGFIFFYLKTRKNFLSEKKKP